MDRIEVPQIGGVCERIPMYITSNGYCENICGWHEVRDNYEIRGFGYGNERFDILFNKIQEEKTKTSLLPPKWNDLLVVKVMLNLPELKKDELNIEQNYNNIFGENYNPTHKANILKYTKQMVCRWRLPLFVSGSIFGKEGSAYMLDGSTRISALVLRGITKIGCLLGIQRNELPRFINKECINKINETRKSIKWFPDYQAIPEIGITTGRTRKRYSLCDFSTIKNETIADFGCNIGQTCLEYFYNGATHVHGFDCQEEVICVANDIKNMLNIDDSSIRYAKVDFNDADFDKQIDKIYPDQFSCSSYYSVYRTKELTQRERVFQYIIDKTRKKIFFEGHADPNIDTLEYYKDLFDSFKLKHTFYGYGEESIRPFFVLEK